MFQAMDAQSLIVLYFDILIVKEVAGGRMCGRKKRIGRKSKGGEAPRLSAGSGAGRCGGWETILI